MKKDIDQIEQLTVESKELAVQNQKLIETYLSLEEQKNVLKSKLKEQEKEGIFLNIRKAALLEDFKKLCNEIRTYKKEFNRMQKTR